MFPIILPAQPGFHVEVEWPGRKQYPPVIAWQMLDANTVIPVTADGVESEDLLIVGPDGTPAHRS